MADAPEVLPHTSGAETGRGEQPEKLEKGQEAGLQLGWRLHPSPQRQASGRPLPSGNWTHGKAALAGESGDGSEATSQWSDVGQLYGLSSTFGRFGLTLVEQSLQEEELRARHQSALLRLRDQALQEQVRAELAWLEHQKRFQGASATMEKDAILTRLKQEQAEILHLQNICRAAHQRRKLILRQHKELSLVQRSTAQLWRQVSGTPPPPAVAGSATDMSEEDEATTASLDLATSSGLEGRAYNHPHPESGETWPPKMETSEGRPGKKFRLDAPCAEMLDVTGTADPEAHKGHPGWTPRPKGDHRRATCSEESAASVSVKASEPAPEMGSPQLDSGFRKAHAVLVHLSGSTPSASDVDADASRATEVSPPEEFAVRDPRRESGKILDGSDVPQVGSEGSASDPPDPLEVSCGDRHDAGLPKPSDSQSCVDQVACQPYGAAQRPEDWRRPTSPVGVAGGDDPRSPRLATDPRPIESARKASSKDVCDPVQGVDWPPGGQAPPFPITPSCGTPHGSSRLENAADRVNCAEPAEGGGVISASRKDPQTKGVGLGAPHTREGLAPAMEDDIRSPVDEVLTYGSADLPSPDATSYPSCDFPAPPEDLSADSEDGSTLKDFPPPPDHHWSPETGEPHGVEEAASLAASRTPWLLSEEPVPGILGPPSVGEAGAASG